MGQKTNSRRSKSSTPHTTRKGQGSEQSGAGAEPHKIGASQSMRVAVAGAAVASLAIIVAFLLAPDGGAGGVQVR